MGLGKKLGRGLDQILSPEPVTVEEKVEMVALERLVPNHLQPRTEFDPERLRELMQSISEHGIMQPLIARPRQDGSFELVAGERRMRASKALGLTQVPVIVRQVEDERLLELALIENVQRENLNPIEKAKAYKQLMETFNLTQEMAAERLGQNRSTVANTIRLLDLPEEVQAMVSRETLSAGHARAVLSVSSPEERLALAQKIAEEHLSVRQAETLASQGIQPKPEKQIKSEKETPPNIRDLEEKLRHHFGTRVTIKENKSKGKIVIEFYSNDDFMRIIEASGVDMDI